MTRIVQVIVLALSLANIFTATTSVNWISHGHDVKAFCEGNRVDLGTIEDLKILAQNLDDTAHKCSPRVVNALRAMRAIVVDRDACTMKKAQAISEFANDYLRDLGADGGGGGGGDDEESGSGAQNNRLPPSLVKFSIAYGMKVSSICKKHMMNDFLYAANAILRKRFHGKFSQFERFLLKKSPLSYVVTPIIRTGEIVLPDDLLQVLPGMRAQLDEYLADPFALDLLRELCQHTLQPLYEPMLLPLAQLIRAGFNNKHFSYPSKMRHHGRFWSLAVFTCEIVKTVKEPNYDSSSEEEDSDQFAARRGRIMRLHAQQVAVGFDLKLEPLPAYEPHEKVTSKILGRCDTALRLVIKSYDANKNEAERLQERIFKRSLSVFAMLSRKGHYGALFRKLLHRFQGDSELEEARKGLVSLMEAPESDSVAFLVGKWGVKIAKKTGVVALIMAVLILFMFSLSLKQGPAKAIHHSLRDSLGKLFSELTR